MYFNHLLFSFLHLAFPFVGTFTRTWAIMSGLCGRTSWFLEAWEA